MIPKNAENNIESTESRIGKLCQAIVSERTSSKTPRFLFQDLWDKTAAAGLFGVGLPESFGGKGGGLTSVAIAGRIITEVFRDTGFSLSWLVHVLVSRLIALYGTPSQQATLLPSLAAGDKTIAIAISEPEKGPHPKYLKTKAIISEEGFVITGEKSWITNGPLADLFIVIAVSGEREGKKTFSALIVPKESPGLTLTEVSPLPVFKGASHCGIRLKGVRVPAGNLLGEINTAYETLVLPFSESENTLMIALAAGGFFALKALLMEALPPGHSTPDEFFIALCELESSLHVAKRASERAAMKLFSPNAAMEPLFLLIFFKDLGKRLECQLERLLCLMEIERGPLFTEILNDLKSAIGLLEKSLQRKQKKAGQTLFEASAFKQKNDRKPLLG